ncbi:MAG: hypothetical protein DRJ38_09365 [Thermoprotei archaeon]|nr:MAG: hypothetical protein DRJ38_09365 [Thermoprotei archaeon]
MAIYEVPIALNIVGGYLAEEGSPLIFLPVEPGLKVELSSTREGLYLGKIEEFVNVRRLEEIMELLFRHSGKRVGIKVVEKYPHYILSLGYEGAILATVAEDLGIDNEFLQRVIEGKVKSAERGLLAGSAICSQVRKPIAYRIDEGYVELEPGIPNMYLYVIGLKNIISLNEVTLHIRKLKKDYSDVFEPLFHAFCRLSIRVAEYLQVGDLEKLFFMLTLGHKILSTAGLISRLINEYVQRIENQDYWAKFLEDIGQYIFTLTVEDLEEKIKKIFKNLEVYKFHVI